MPHKHKRKKIESESQFDLLPSRKAQPLPVDKLTKDSSEQTIKSSRKKKSNGYYATDDTPRKFARLLAIQKKGRIPIGLDDGVDRREGKKRKPEDIPLDNGRRKSVRKTDDVVVDDVQEDLQESELPLRIQHNERLSDFAARVDRTLPIAGLASKVKNIEGMPERQTKHERRLRRLQDNWRRDEARIRDKEEEEKELAEEKWEDQIAAMDIGEARTAMISMFKGGGKKISRKTGKLVGEMDEGDPWAILNNKRDAPKGIFDVAQAPPKFEKPPRVALKGVKVTNVPKLAGSLKRREDLRQTRAEVIKGYREKMARRRQ